MTSDHPRKVWTDKDLRRSGASRPWRSHLARLLFALAVIVAAQHLLAHAGLRPLPVSMGWQDLFLGYPMAALIALSAAFLLPAQRRPSRRGRR